MGIKKSYKFLNNLLNKQHIVLLSENVGCAEKQAEPQLRMELKDGKRRLKKADQEYGKNSQVIDAKNLNIQIKRKHETKAMQHPLWGYPIKATLHI